MAKAIPTILKIINHDYFDYEKLATADYDELGKLAEQIDTKMTYAELQIFKSAPEAKRTAKRILNIKKETNTTDEFKDKLYSLALSLSENYEEHLKDLVNSTNERLGIDPQLDYINSRLSGEAVKKSFTSPNAILYRRTTKGATCEWCKALAGTWANAEASNGVSLFVRHSGCDCKFEVIKGNQATELAKVQEMTPTQWKERQFTEQQRATNGN